VPALVPVRVPPSPPEPLVVAVPVLPEPEPLPEPVPLAAVPLVPLVDAPEPLPEPAAVLPMVLLLAAPEPLPEPLPDEVPCATAATLNEIAAAATVLNNAYRMVSSEVEAHERAVPDTATARDEDSSGAARHIRAARGRSRPRAHLRPGKTGCLPCGSPPPSLLNSA
jgi:hypothetical protein